MTFINFVVAFGYLAFLIIFIYLSANFLVKDEVISLDESFIVRCEKKDLKMLSKSIEAAPMDSMHPLIKKKIVSNKK